MKQAAFALFVALVVVGADLAWRRPGSPPSGAAAERWTAADAAALDESVARLEERLLAHQARVAFWQEMRTRHEQVTAVACDNLRGHADSMARSEGRSRLRVAEMRDTEKKRRVAADFDLGT